MAAPKQNKIEIKMNEAIKMLKDYQYKPYAIWLSFDKKTFWVVADDIDRSKYCTLFKRF
jgi:ribosomal protein L25 (general stress protein Ctc)